VRIRRGGRARLQLKPGTRLRIGSYVLTIIGGRKHGQRILMRQTIRVV